MALYENIKKRCKETGHTVNEIEKSLCFARSSICKWDTNIPNVAKVMMVAEYLDTTIDELLKGVRFDK